MNFILNVGISRPCGLYGYIVISIFFFKSLYIYTYRKSTEKSHHQHSAGGPPHPCGPRLFCTFPISIILRKIHYKHNYQSSTFAWRETFLYFPYKYKFSERNIISRTISLAPSHGEAGIWFSQKNDTCLFLNL